MSRLHVLIYFKNRLICRFHEWDDVTYERGRVTVYHSDGESTLFTGGDYSYKIIEVDDKKVTVYI